VGFELSVGMDSISLWTVGFCSQLWVGLAAGLLESVERGSRCGQSA
jgi:hypothetical protein